MKPFMYNGPCSPQKRRREYLQQPLLTDWIILVRNVDGKEVNIRSAWALVVVSNLEVAGGRIKRVGAKSLSCSAVDADTEDVAGIADCVGELLANGNIANLGHDFVAARASLFHAHSQVAVGVVVQLAHWLGANVVRDVDLANNSAIAWVVWLFHGERHRQLVVAGIGVPAAGAAFAQLRAAVLAVWCSDTAGVWGCSRDFHDQGAVATLSEEVFVAGILVTPTARELGSGNRGWAARRADGKLQGPIGKVKVAAGSTAGVERCWGNANKASGQKSLEGRHDDCRKNWRMAELSWCNGFEDEDKKVDNEEDNLAILYIDTVANSE